MKISTVLVLVAFVAVGMDIAYARLPVHKKQQKPGVCPEVSRGQFGICVEACSGDLSCPGEQKCCSNGCGHACTSPVFKGLCPSSGCSEYVISWASQHLICQPFYTQQVSLCLEKQTEPMGQTYDCKANKENPKSMVPTLRKDRLEFTSKACSDFSIKEDFSSSEEVISFGFHI